ncbi:MAG: zf-HC2 domain-containing protein [Clostridia bacterium]|nr:zf-HC2 domain-containing protein [Clostridia bacterium]
MKDCGIVRDLLPLIAENMASEESTAFVREHLKTCPDCRAAYETMKAPVDAEPAAPLFTVRRAVKRRGLLNAGLIACLVAALVIGAASRLLKPFAISSKDAAFASVELQGAIHSAVQGNDLILENVEIDLETGEAYLITDGGERIPLETSTVPVKETERPGSGVIAGTLSRRLVLKTDPACSTVVTVNEGEVSVSVYTTLWRELTGSDGEPVQTVIPLDGVDAVFFEPYDNTEREPLYVREGYAPESGFALPRLVMNYYFLIAVIGTAVLAIAWLVLLLLKKRTARRVLGVLLLIAGSFVLAFLAAGFPATTIAPVRELAFVLVITLLLIGAGLCGRTLLRRE